MVFAFTFMSTFALVAPQIKRHTRLQQTFQMNASKGNVRMQLFVTSATPVYKISFSRVFLEGSNLGQIKKNGLIPSTSKLVQLGQPALHVARATILQVLNESMHID